MNFVASRLLSLALCMILSGTAWAAEPKPPPAPPAPSPSGSEVPDDEAPLAGYTDGYFFLRSRKSNFVLLPNGRLNVDAAFFPDRAPPPSAPPGGPPPNVIVPNSLADQRPRHSIFIRRARAELGGTFLKHFDFFVSGEFATDPIFFQSSMFADVWLNVNYTPWANVMVGQFDAPFTLENRTVDKFIDFMERSISVRSLGAPSNKEMGLMVWGLAPRNYLHYSLGVFNGDGPNTRNVDSQFDIIGRAYLAPLALHPAAPETRWLNEIWVGGSVWWGRHSVTPYPLFPVTTQGGVTLMPPLFEAGGKTYNLGLNGEQLKWAVEVNAPVGPFGLRFELVRIEREELGLYENQPPTAWDRAPADAVTRSATSFYLQAWYWILGDYRMLPIPGQEIPTRWKGYKAEEKPWRIGLYLSAKYERVNLSIEDGNPSVQTEGKQAVLRGLSVDVGEVAANLWLSKHLRFSVNYAVNFLDGDMRLIQGGYKFPPVGPLVQPTYTDYRTPQHEIMMRVAVGL